MQIGLAGLLTIIFVLAKLGGFIAWSWLWVLSPVWIGAAIGIIFLSLAVAIGVLLDK